MNQIPFGVAANHHLPAECGPVAGFHLTKKLLTCTYRYVSIQHMRARETVLVNMTSRMLDGRSMRALNLSLELLLGSMAALLILANGAGSG